jgi:hypothetical protein
MRFTLLPSRPSSSLHTDGGGIAGYAEKRCPKPITDVDGNVMDTNPFHYLGIINIKDALRKLRPEEYDD